MKSSAQSAELPATSAGLEAGEIPAGHARLIARAASEGPIDEAVLAEAAQSENYDKFAKTLRNHQQEMSDDDGQSIFDRQRENRAGRAFVSRETGMFVLSGEFDPTTGASAHRCFAHHVQFWRNGGPTDFANLVLVCNKCHHSIHDDGWEVTHEPGTGCRSVDPPPDSFPDTGVDTYRPPQVNPVLLS